MCGCKARSCRCEATATATGKAFDYLKSFSIWLCNSKTHRNPLIVTHNPTHSIKLISRKLIYYSHGHTSHIVLVPFIIFCSVCERLIDNFILMVSGDWKNILKFIYIFLLSDISWVIFPWIFKFFMNFHFIIVSFCRSLRSPKFKYFGEKKCINNCRNRQFSTFPPYASRCPSSWTPSHSQRYSLVSRLFWCCGLVVVKYALISLVLKSCYSLKIINILWPLAIH